MTALDRAALAGIAEAGSLTLGVGMVISATGYEVSMSRAEALTGGAGATPNGVPSTGQKLNLSANCSWHVLQNFIFTTSLSRWG
jgi:hypothetical protein